MTLVRKEIVRLEQYHRPSQSVAANPADDVLVCPVLETLQRVVLAQIVLERHKVSELPFGLFEVVVVFEGESAHQVFHFHFHVLDVIVVDVLLVEEFITFEHLVFELFVLHEMLCWQA
jgi:hypothetical protein